ncbi:PAS domain-containing sensor histidine kinase [Bdellovibrio bacteriovorus]|uniref:histidine kinase n=1 Tax=Bdellovibrio bacteriovorus TaxID=959 RepID=A0A161PPR0_BDEBC|nr:ATP-binding protein [Bdellovibrio bacteriovorus]KYG62616.1 PAS domain-containing sensor histidine kinase [Bdellovibrio bacteriovorus]
MKRFVRFPWRVYWKFFFTQLVAFNILFIAIISIIDVRYRVRPFVYNEALLNFFLFSLIVAALTSYRFARPIHRMILKALRISSKRTYGSLVDPQEDDLLDDEVDDISELDVALNHIHRKMKKRKAQYLQAQEESQAFMSAVAEGLVSVSLDEKILYFNSQFAAQFISPNLVNSTVLRLKDAIRSSDVLEGFSKTIQEGKVQRFTVKLPTLVDNQPRYFAVSVNPIRNEKTKNIYGVVGIFHDITELKKVEQIRIDFVGNASHELRTPLTSIKGYVDTLKEDVKTGQIQQAGKFLDIVSRNIDRLMDLVNDLLSLSTLESHAELKLEMIHPLQVSEHILAEMAVLAAEKNIAIRVIGEVPPFMADAHKVEQVLRNLVSNAIKFIPSGKTVQIRWEAAGKDAVILRVIDDGQGIPEEHLDRLFERFYRVDKGRTRDAGGTGLGLAIVKHIMQSHGGTVSVKSGRDKGCEFICTFPLKT